MELETCRWNDVYFAVINWDVEQLREELERQNDAADRQLSTSSRDEEAVAPLPRRHASIIQTMSAVHAAWDESGDAESC